MKKKPVVFHAELPEFSGQTEPLSSVLRTQRAKGKLDIVTGQYETEITPLIRSILDGR